MTVRIKGIVWLGTQTSHFDEMAALYAKVFGLPRVAEDAGFAAFALPNGDTLELFAQDSQWNQHFTTGPVAGFEVDDIEAARAEMEANGIEFIGPIDSGRTSRWSHFRAPDGNVYELTQRL